MMRVFALLMIAGALAGCATKEESVAIKYNPNSFEGVHGARPVNLTVADGRTTDRGRISTKMNGYGMEMAAIRSAAEVPDVVRDALKTEFELRGFHVETNGLPVTVTVDRFYNQYSTGFWSGTAKGDAELAVSVSDATGAKLYAQTYAGDSTTSVQLANGANAAESVAAALKNAVGKMFADPGFIGALTKPSTETKPVS